MAQITIENLTFTYPKALKPTLKEIQAEIQKGDFVLICGKSGCGKTTLLRQIKNSLAPFGEKKGRVLFEETDISAMKAGEEAAKIGFVFQQPEHQSVTDKVWHELAFGLENLGMKSEEIRLRVAETSDYFGFTDKLYQDIETLSGGQKQLLNIAAVMAMQPEVMILDEPTAQLDPIAAENLLSTIYKINRDFGITIILSEHRLERVFDMATKVLVMDQGSVICQGEPRAIAMGLKNTEFFMAMPESVKLYSMYEDNEEKCPLTVGEARRWLAQCDDTVRIRMEKTLEEQGDTSRRESGKRKKEKAAIEVKDIWFRYEKNGKDIVKGLSLHVDKNEIFGIVGGNGAGKSTILSILCGVLKQYRGSVIKNGKVAMLVQDVQCLFLKDEVKKELECVLPKKGIISGTNLSDCLEVENGEVLRIIEQMGLKDKMDRHPYDLSGGEQQKLGLAKLLLTEPDILLLDEPTKGMDDVFVQNFGELLLKLKHQGKTIVVVSHDLEFLAKYTDRCGMFFDGRIISENETGMFFRGNRYYTTEREKILRK